MPLSGIVLLLLLSFHFPLIQCHEELIDKEHGVTVPQFSQRNKNGQLNKVDDLGQAKSEPKPRGVSQKG